MIQFKSTRIHLEKGSQRGYVVVVFDITEASNIQYDVGYRYQKTDTYSQPNFCLIYADSGGHGCAPVTIEKDISDHIFSGKITDFNFLGQGKELSLSIDKNYANSAENSILDLSRASFGPIEVELPTKVNKNGDYENNNYKLEYFDPHLFGSAKYYFRTSIGKMNNFSEHNSYYFYKNRGERRYPSSSKQISKNIDCL